jgi:multidrug efflux pump subunit AcrA (membrane-fusion protein)
LKNINALKKIIVRSTVILVGTLLISQVSLSQSNDHFQNIPTVPSAAPMMQHQPEIANQLHFRDGILEIPRFHHITLSATERAVVMSLSTEQRDANGDVVIGDDGNPIMIPVREGMAVFRGQVIGRFDDRELQSFLKINQAQLEVAKAERDKEIEIIYAAHGVRVAIAELLAMENSNRQHPGIFPQIEIDRARLAVAQAEAQLELQKYTLEEIRTREVTVRENELARTQVQIDLRRLVSPIDGMVVRIGAAEGEWLREGDPVFEIMQLDTMRVMVRVNANRYSISDVDGRDAIIRVRLADGSVETFHGRVVFCDPMIRAGDDSFEVFIEIQNRRSGNHWLLKPGRAQVDIVIPL